MLEILSRFVNGLHFAIGDGNDLIGFVMFKIRDVHGSSEVEAFLIPHPTRPHQEREDKTYSQHSRNGCLTIWGRSNAVETNYGQP